MTWVTFQSYIVPVAQIKALMSQMFIFAEFYAFKNTFKNFCKPTRNCKCNWSLFTVYVSFRAIFLSMSQWKYSVVRVKSKTLNRMFSKIQQQPYLFENVQSCFLCCLSVVFFSQVHMWRSQPSLSCSFFPAELPQFVKEPEKHITAEMEKVVDIPCQARGETPPDISS